MTHRKPSKVDEALLTPTGIDFKDKETLQAFVEQFSKRVDELTVGRGLAQDVDHSQQQAPRFKR